MVFHLGITTLTIIVEQPTISLSSIHNSSIFPAQNHGISQMQDREYHILSAVYLFQSPAWINNLQIRQPKGCAIYIPTLGILST